MPIDTHALFDSYDARDIFGDTILDEVDPPEFDVCIRRARELVRANGLTHEELGQGVRRRHAIGVEQFREVLKGKRQPRGWHRLMLAIAQALADEDARPLPADAKADGYLRLIYGLPTAPRYCVMDFAAWVAEREDYARLTDRLIALDRASIPGLTEESEGTPEQWTEIHEALPDCGRLLVAEDGAIVGYWFYVPMNPAAYERAAAGELEDAELWLADIAFPGPRGAHDLYLVVMTLDPARRNTVTRHRLVESLFAHLEELAALDLYVDRLCLCAYSLESEALAQSLGMRRGASHASYRLQEGGERSRPADMYTITAADIAQAPRIARHWPRLAARYAAWSENP